MFNSNKNSNNPFTFNSNNINPFNNFINSYDYKLDNFITNNYNNNNLNNNMNLNCYNQQLKNYNLLFSDNNIEKNINLQNNYNFNFSDMNNDNFNSQVNFDYNFIYQNNFSNNFNNHNNFTNNFNNQNHFNNNFSNYNIFNTNESLDLLNAFSLNNNNNFNHQQQKYNNYNNSKHGKNKIFNNNNDQISNNNINNSKIKIYDVRQIDELINKGIQLLQIPNENDENNKILSKIKSEILAAAEDVTGNYAIQKILNFKDQNKSNFIINSLKNNIYELTLHLYGCRVVEEIISILDDCYLITKELKPFYLKCIEDKNGNHVIQKLIEYLKEEELDDVYLVTINSMKSLSKHQYGCRIIQKLLKYCNNTQINEMLKKIFQNINELIRNQYGNYVIQYILENENIDRDLLMPIYDNLKGHIYEYSMNKFASNVVEKALVNGKKEQKQNMINEIVEIAKNNPEYIINMVKDKFGNYVIQKIIEYGEKSDKEKLIEVILDKQNIIKNEGFSKYVLNYIEKIINKEINNYEKLSKKGKITEVNMVKGIIKKI